MERPNKEPPEEENHRSFWLRGPFWIIQLPLLGMLAMIGFLALVMRSTGKW